MGGQGGLLKHGKRQDSLVARTSGLGLHHHGSGCAVILEHAGRREDMDFDQEQQTLPEPGGQDLQVGRFEVQEEGAHCQ